MVIIKFPRSLNDIRYLSVTGLSVWLLGDIIASFAIPFAETINTMFQSLSISLLLVVFLVLIRKLKPVIFQYPYPLVFIPLLIPIAHFIVLDTLIMKNIIFMTLQGVSLLVFILFSIGYRRSIEHELMVIIGIVSLLWGFSFYWILQEYYIVFEWSWGIANSIGLIASTLGFSEILQSELQTNDSET